MNIPKIPKDLVLKRFFSKTKPNISNESTVNIKDLDEDCEVVTICLLYTSPSPRDVEESRMPSSA